MSCIKMLRNNLLRLKDYFNIDKDGFCIEELILFVKSPLNRFNILL